MTVEEQEGTILLLPLIPVFEETVKSFIIIYKVLAFTSESVNSPSFSDIINNCPSISNDVV